MKQPSAVSGRFQNGVAYNRVGGGPGTLVIFQGLTFDNAPLPAAMGWLYGSYYHYLAKDYTVFVVLPRRGLPQGCSMRDLSDDYAAAVDAELGGPVDVIGISTGGSIAHHFAADHPGLVRSLVIQSSAHTLSDFTRRLQLRVAGLARQRRWQAAYAALFDAVLPRSPALRGLVSPLAWLGTFLAGVFGAPADPSDLVATIEAEDKHAFRERLPEIRARTLVAGGDRDPFYPVSLFRETAEGIPNARLAVYPGVGHPASGAQFRRDVLAFLREGAAASG
jgi:pimeloyl-ACP methyl ester carboxylesterase